MSWHSLDFLILGGISDRREAIKALCGRGFPTPTGLWVENQGVSWSHNAVSADGVTVSADQALGRMFGFMANEE